MKERVNLYAASLYSVCCEEKCSKDVYDSLKLAEKIIKDNEEYVKIVSSANLESDEREQLIGEAFIENVHVFALNFVKMLAKKRIFHIFIPCVEEYERGYFKDNNIAYATVTTAIELSAVKKKEVVEKVGALIGKTIIPTFIVDKSIVGGIIIETENSAIDASVRGKLQSIKRYIGKN